MSYNIEVEGDLAEAGDSLRGAKAYARDMVREGGKAILNGSGHWTSVDWAIVLKTSDDREDQAVYAIWREDAGDHEYRYFESRTQTEANEIWQHVRATRKPLGTGRRLAMKSNPLRYTGTVPAHDKRSTIIDPSTRPLIEFRAVPIGGLFKENASNKATVYLKTSARKYVGLAGVTRQEQAEESVFPALKMEVRLVARHWMYADTWFQVLAKHYMGGHGRRRNPTDDEAPVTERSDSRVHRIYDEPVTERTPISFNGSVTERASSAKTQFAQPIYAGPARVEQPHAEISAHRTMVSAGAARVAGEPGEKMVLETGSDRSGYRYLVTSLANGRYRVRRHGGDGRGMKIDGLSSVEARSLAQSLSTNMSLQDAKILAKTEGIAQQAREGYAEAKKAWGSGVADLKAAWANRGGRRAAPSEKRALAPLPYAKGVPMLPPPPAPAKPSKKSKSSKPSKKPAAKPSKKPVTKKISPRAKARAKTAKLTKRSKVKTSAKKFKSKR